MSKSAPKNPSAKPTASSQAPAHSRNFSLRRNIGFAFWIIFLLVAVEASLAGLIPLSVRFFIDHVSGPRDQAAFAFMLAVLGGAAVLALLAGAVRDILASRSLTKALGALRQFMFAQIRYRSLTLNTKDKNQEVLDRFSDDLALIESATMGAIPQAILPWMEAMFCEIVMLWLDWRVGLAALLLWPWTILSPTVTAVRAAGARKLSEDDNKTLLTAVSETLEAQPVIRAFSIEQSSTAVFRKRNDLLTGSNRKVHSLTSSMDRLTGIGELVLRVSLLALCAWLAFNGMMTIGAFVALPILIFTLNSGLLAAVRFIPVYSAARSAYKRACNLLATDTAEDTDGGKILPPIHSEIGLSDVSFSYDDSDEAPAISSFTARIPRGSYVAIVGPSGAGKSTLLKLLMHFYDPDSGRITFDGHDLRSVSASSLRGQIGVVLQDNYVFNASLRDNIRIGKREASEEAVVSVARIVGLHDMIMQLPSAYDSPVGEGGVHFSPGGLQRLALARALVRDPLILILDEATSALDPAEEADINRIVAGVRKGRTVISLSHRLATVADADHIFMLENGKLVEQGNHFDLLAMEGSYAAYWKKQAGFTFTEDGRHVDVDAHRLKSFPILSEVDERALADIAPWFATETFQPGRDIVKQNDPGDKFYIIVRGKVEVRRTEEQSGLTNRMAVLHDGDFFGEITLLTGFPRTASVRARTVCTCISLERVHFNRMLERFPELKRKMSEIAILRLRESSRAVQPTPA
jgi:ATP-binding cassette subfamily B protein